MIFLHRAFQAVVAIMLVGFTVALLTSIGFTGLLSVMLCLTLTIVLFIKYKNSNQLQEKITQFLNNSKLLKIAIVINLAINLMILLMWVRIFKLMMYQTH